MIQSTCTLLFYIMNDKPSMIWIHHITMNNVDPAKPQSHGNKQNKDVELKI